MTTFYDQALEAFTGLGRRHRPGLVRSFLDAYGYLSQDEEREFLHRLAGDGFSLNRSSFNVVAQAILHELPPTLPDALAFMFDRSPRRRALREISKVPEGLQALFNIHAKFQPPRGDLREHAGFQPLIRDLGDLFKDWCAHRNVELRRVEANADKRILDRLTRYEQVHEITDEHTLERRLAADRFVFSYFHPSMPIEPVVFTEVALVKGIANNIGRLLRKDEEILKPEEADTAIFYSISSMVLGNKLGRYLIEQTMEFIARNHPNIRTFATLSPLQGFNGQAELGDSPETFEASVIQHLFTRDNRGRPKDRVAQFHLSNGASIGRIVNSDGVPMVNYIYDPHFIESNREAYARGYIVCDDDLVWSYGHLAQDVDTPVDMWEKSIDLHKAFLRQVGPMYDPTGTLARVRALDWILNGLDDVNNPAP